MEIDLVLVDDWELRGNGSGDPTGVTTFFIDEGIDTGPNIVVREQVSVDGHRTIEAAKNYLFSKDLEMFAKALRRLGAVEELLAQPIGEDLR